METTTLTSMEIVGLKSITDADFYENGKDSCPWDFSVFDACPLKGKTRSGVFSSLVQKGLITIQEAEKKFIKDKDGNKILNEYWSRDGLNFGVIRITELGYQVLDNHGLIDEDGYWKREQK
jgi:hypothetical protein